MPLTPEFEEQIHRRLLSGDKTATSDLAEAFADELRSWLRHRVTNLRDPHLYDESAAEAILNYGENPGSFNPARLNLAKYLQMSAKGDLLNGIAKESRRNNGETVSLAEGVEQDGFDGNTWIERLFASREGLRTAEELLVRFLDLQNAKRDFLKTVPTKDLSAVDVWFKGVRETSEYVPLLGLNGMDKDTQEREVKRFKDRYNLQLTRWIAKNRGMDAVQ